MATAVKKYHEDRDKNYIDNLSDDNYIRADTGTIETFSLNN